MFNLIIPNTLSAAAWLLTRDKINSPCKNHFKLSFAFCSKILFMLTYSIVASVDLVYLVWVRETSTGCLAHRCASFKDIKGD